jgi:hypothetical protein
MGKPIHIVGHGLCGTVLAMTCFRHKIPFCLNGTSIPGESSIASSGLINPITGRRYVKAWMIDELIPFALVYYHWTEQLFNNDYFQPVEIVRFLSHPEAWKAWESRLTDTAYQEYISDKRYECVAKIKKSYGIVTGGYRLDTSGWIKASHRFLKEHNLLQIHSSALRMDDLKNDTVIFATGAIDTDLCHGVIPNKGEALIVRMPDWQIPLVVKDEIYIVPLENDQYWIGSYYEPGSADPYPTDAGKNKLLNSLFQVYSGPIEVVEHMAGIRPTVEDRRPLIGQMPGYQDKYVFNGMGTKGTSLAPYWADRLIRHVVDGLSLPQEVSPTRY